MTQVLLGTKAKSKQSYKTHKTSQLSKKRFGLFQKYLDSLDKSDNYANATKELVNTFKWLGPPSANLFLYTVGEKIEPGKKHYFLFVKIIFLNLIFSLNSKNVNES